MKIILFPASAKATKFLFELTDVIMQLSSNGPHSFKIFPVGFITRICSAVEAKTVSPKFESDVTGEDVFVLQIRLRSIS